MFFFFLFFSLPVYPYNVKCKIKSVRPITVSGLALTIVFNANQAIPRMFLNEMTLSWH